MDRSTETRHTMLVGGLLSAVTLAVFWPVVHHDFIVYDDGAYVVSNLMVQRGLTWAGVGWAFTTFHAGNWHPLTWLSHMLDCQLYGLNPGGHHFTSLLLHSANASLLFVVLQRLTGARWRSAWVAALFALHPLHVESVAWVAERKDVLSAFFFMLTLWAYCRHAEVQSPKSKVQSPESESAPRSAVPSSTFDVHPPSAVLLRRTGHSMFAVRPFPPSPFAPRRFWYWIAVVLFALGLMSKPMLVTLPFVLLLLDYWPLRRLCLPTLHSSTTPSLHPSTTAPLRLVLEKLPFLALSAATSVVTVLAQWSSGAVESLERVPLAARLANVLMAHLGYLEKMVWPTRLAILYLRPGHWPLWRVGLAVLVLAGISVLVLALGRGRGWLTVGWLWFLGMLVPVSGLMQVGNQYMADRYSYLPLIGPFLIVAWGGWGLAGKQKRRVLASAALLGLMAAGAVAQRQVGYWQNSETIFGHCLAVTANNHVAHNNLGAALAQQGRAEEAKAQFLAAWRLQPHDADTLYNVGLLLTDQGKFEEGAPYLEEAVGIKPELGAVYGELGLRLDARGNMAQAIACYREGVRLRPRQVETANNLAWILATTPDARLRDGNEAVRVAEQACEASGYKQALVVGTLAAAYAEAGRFSQAVGTAERAIALATAAGQPELADRNRQLLELYRASKPFRETRGQGVE